MTRYRKATTVLLAFALLGLTSLAATGDVRATQNAPSWSTGNQWIYTSTGGSSTSTLTMTVKEQTSLTLGATTYTVWHVTATTTTTSGSASFSFTLDQYYTVDGLRFAKQISTLFGTVTETYDAPYPLAVFPLNPGASWVGSSTKTTMSGFGTGTSTYNWNGTVIGERSVQVPAGTYTASVVWSKSAGGGQPAVYYYSEQAGWAVRIDSYTNGGRYTGSANLTSTNYSPGLLGISNTVWIAGLVIALIGIVAAITFLRRRPRAPYGMPPQPYPPPPSPSPPQQGPPGPQR